MNSEISEESVQKSFKVLSSKGTAIRASEVSAKTGMSLEESKTALLELLTRYKGELTLNEQSGEPLFQFVFPLIRRKKAVGREVLSTIFSVLLNTFLGLMKASIAIVILGLFFIFAILPLLAPKNKNRTTRANPVLMMVLPMFMETMVNVIKSIFSYSDRRKIKYELNANGERYRVLDYQPYKTQGGFSGLFKSDKNITDVAFDFVFGKKRAVYTDEEITIRALKTIILNKGYLTAGMLIKLEGYDFDESHKKMIEYSLKYSGDINFNEDGVAYSYFPEFTGFDLGRDDIELIEYTDEIEPPYVLTGNTSRENLMIVLLMIIPALLTFGLFNGPNTLLSSGNFLIFFTVSFTFFFFGTPIIRFPFITYFNKIIDRKNRRRKIYKSIFEGLKSSSIGADKLTNLNVPQKLLFSTISDLNGEVVTDNSGKNTIDFTRVYKELNFRES